MFNSIFIKKLKNINITRLYDKKYDKMCPTDPSKYIIIESNINNELNKFINMEVNNNNISNNISNIIKYSDNDDYPEVFISLLG